jgi:tetratricopeptide (TPR) repeat protein
MFNGEALSAEARLEKIRRDQTFALELITGDQGDQALALLAQIEDALQEFEGSLEWAKQPFLLARAYALSNHRAAESFFKEAINRNSKLANSDPLHGFGVHKSFGRYLFGFRRYREALKQYETAERIALALGPSEELDQLHLRIIETKLHINNDVKAQKNFEILKSVSRECTPSHQHRAWIKHEQLRQDTVSEALFLRETQILDAAYFKHLLESTRETEIEA